MINKIDSDDALEEVAALQGGSVNFVFSKGNQNLRFLENKFADGIQAFFSDCKVTRGIKKLSDKEKCVDVTFWIKRKADVMMSHGLGDKNYLTRKSNGTAEINKYKKILVPGSWLKSKILNTPGVDLGEKDIEIVGWPRLDEFFSIMSARKDVRRMRDNKIKVLYAPTHGGRPGTSSWPDFNKYTNILSDLFDYEISVHPNDRNGGVSTEDLLLDADVVIADQGTILYEAWALKKSVIHPSWLIRNGICKSLPGSAEEYIYKNLIGNHAFSFDELIDMVRAMPFTDNNVTSFLSDYYDFTTQGKSYALIAKSIRNVMNNNI